MFGQSKSIFRKSRFRSLTVKLVSGRCGVGLENQSFQDSSPKTVESTALEFEAQLKSDHPWAAVAA
jgi:hypothetical protein